MIASPNQVICGDSLKVLDKLKDELIDLCYLDPPFFTNRSFIAKENGRKINSFDDKWNNDLDAYLDFMREIFTQCHRVLKETGSLYLHCDWHASHYLKIELDNIFKRKNFRNEIVWRRHNAHNDTKQGAKSFGKIHDVILFYTKSGKYTWNPMYEAYPPEYVKKYYNHIEPKTNRLYALGDLSGPGGRTKGNPRYKFLGITRYWRYSEKTMKRLYREGRIIQRRKGTVPLLKRYLDEMKGIMLQDVWNDIVSVQLSKKENVGYPTQKPVKLLERIIQISTTEKNIVLDPFCGSGTTLLSAVNLERKYIGIDSNSNACKISRKRLRNRKIIRSPKIKEPIIVYPAI